MLPSYCTDPLVPWLIRYWIEDNVAKCSCQKGCFWWFLAFLCCFLHYCYILFAYFFAYFKYIYNAEYQYFCSLVFVLFFVIALACVFIYKKKVVSLQRKWYAYSAWKFKQTNKQWYLIHQKSILYETQIYITSRTSMCKHDVFCCYWLECLWMAW